MGRDEGPIQETHFFTDDVKLLHDLIDDEWSLGNVNRPNIAYKPESQMINARLGSIYIYQLTRPSSISSVDYNTLERTSMVSLKLQTRDRDKHFEWANEIYRILLSNRRIGKGRLGPYTFMEVLRDRTSNDNDGWYSTTFDIQLKGYCVPIKTNGFGNDINKQLGNYNYNGDIL